MSFPSTGSPTKARKHSERESLSNDSDFNAHSMPFGRDISVS